jgi:hypothetical protein
MRYPNRHQVRALEAKYLNSGSPFYKMYQKASLKEQRRILIEREAGFYHPFEGNDGREDRTSSRRDHRFGQWQAWRGMGHLCPGDRRGSPARAWMAAPREVKCYCRILHMFTWKTTAPTELTHCDGLEIPMEKCRKQKVAEGSTRNPRLQCLAAWHRFHPRCF